MAQLSNEYCLPQDLQKCPLDLLNIKWSSRCPSSLHMSCYFNSLGRYSSRRWCRVIPSWFWNEVKLTRRKHLLRRGSFIVIVPLSHFSFMVLPLLLFPPSFFSRLDFSGEENYLLFTVVDAVSELTNMRWIKNRSQCATWQRNQLAR